MLLPFVLQEYSLGRISGILPYILMVDSEPDLQGFIQNP